MRPAVSVLVVAMLFSVPAIAADHPASSFAGVWATEDGGRVNVNVAAHRIVSTYPDGDILPALKGRASHKPGHPPPEAG